MGVDVGWNKVYKLRSNFKELSGDEMEAKERRYWWRWCLIYFHVDMLYSYRCHNNNQVYVVMKVSIWVAFVFSITSFQGLVNIFD